VIPIRVLLAATSVLAGTLLTSPAATASGPYSRYYGDFSHFGYRHRAPYISKFERHRLRLSPERYLRHTDAPIHYKAQQFLRYSEFGGADPDVIRELWPDRFRLSPDQRPREMNPDPAGPNGSGYQQESGTQILIIPSPRTAPRDDADEDERRSPGLDIAWNHLREGDAVAALGRFSAIMMMRSAGTETRIGYALAAAMYGDDRTATDSLRIALQLDPDAFAAFEPDEQLRLRITKLIESHTPDDGEEPPIDDAFMLAAMQTLLHDDDAAGATLARLENDDEHRDALAVTLRAIVNDRGDALPDEDALTSAETD
jgi:hypothetical protein